MDRNRDDLLANLAFVYQAYLSLGVNEVSGGTETFASSRKNKDFWSFWANQILAFLAYFVPCPTKLQREQGA